MPPTRPDDSRLATIRALLAKAEATTFAAEAEAFTAKATELMARYAIDEAVLWATDPGDHSVPTEVRLTIHRPFTAQKAVLVNEVSNVFGCRAVRLGATADRRAETISVIGFPGDLALVETLVTSLFLQLTTAMTSSGGQPSARSGSQVAAWRRSFISGFTAIVTDRLRSDRARATAERDGEATSAPGATVRSVELVLRDRTAAVADDLKSRYPHLRTSRVSAGSSEAGHRAGHDAGRRADLGAKRLDRRGALQRGR